jgi:hypothetical protein
MYEKTSVMLADPLTKMMDGKVYMERGVMSVVPFDQIKLADD